MVYKQGAVEKLGKIEMKILITGNMGYLGPIVVQEIKKNYPHAYLVGIDTGFFGHCLIDPRRSIPEITLNEQIFLDIRELSTDMLETVDVVIHMAAISNDPMGNIYETQTHEINAVASARLAIMAKNAGVKSFVFASSCSMYGAGGDSPRTEKNELNPLTAYARSKVFFERELEKLSDSTFKVTCLRFATACGWSPRCRFDLVLNDFVISAMTTGKITILSDGTPWRPLIHVKDMAKAILWAMDRDKGGNFLAINTGKNTNNYQVRELAEIVASVVQGVKIEVHQKTSIDKRSYKVDFSLMEELAPRNLITWTVKDAAADLQDKLKACIFQAGEFKTSNFIRFSILKNLQDADELNSNLRWTRYSNE